MAQRGRKPENPKSPAIPKSIRICETCKGQGVYKGKTCTACHGRGGVSVGNV